uniref:C2H2-type domain-containing protein n=1 Tax=Hucho hucho TaxID=62062 RepID=A0A4W5R0Z5_9TELE
FHRSVIDLETTASSDLAEHLSCSICTEIYTEPVSLSCHLNAGHQLCPEGRALIRARNFQINRLIRNVAYQLKLAEDPKRPKATPERGNGREDECCEHGEALKLPCETDSNLISGICRDGRDDRGHTFQPIREAHKDLKKEVASYLCYFKKDISVLEYDEQQREIGEYDKMIKRNMIEGKMIEGI